MIRYRLAIVFAGCVYTAGVTALGLVLTAVAGAKAISASWSLLREDWNVSP